MMMMVGHLVLQARMFVLLQQAFVYVRLACGSSQTNKAWRFGKVLWMEIAVHGEVFLGMESAFVEPVVSFLFALHAYSSFSS
jgi:hypothetical protein